MVVSALAADGGNEILSLFRLVSESCVGHINIPRDHVSCWCSIDCCYNVLIEAGTCQEVLTVDITDFRFWYDKNVSFGEAFDEVCFEEFC